MTDDREEYWLVYLFDPDSDRWIALGLVEERETWYDWWERVCEGEVELPNRFDGWWCSDRPITFGLPDGDDPRGGSE